MAKRHYQRIRPFLLNKKPICTPKDKEALKTDAILARGKAYGQSRMVCNVHWYSDLLAGRLMGASTITKLHVDPHFMADLKSAKKELEELRVKGAQPNSDCMFENDALGIKITNNML